MLIPVVILFSSSALCRVISGIVTTPPPRPSLSTLSALMTVMARGYSGPSPSRVSVRATLGFGESSARAGTMPGESELQPQTGTRDALARPDRTVPPPAGDKRPDLQPARRYPRAVPGVAEKPGAVREGRGARRLLPVRILAEPAAARAEPARRRQAL